MSLFPSCTGVDIGAYTVYNPSLQLSFRCKILLKMHVTATRVKSDSLHQVELIRRDYCANGGWETFLSYEDPEQDILIGLLRLRKCSEDTYRPELKGGCSIVRELHVYGSVVPVHARDPTKFQHQVRT